MSALLKAPTTAISEGTLAIQSHFLFSNKLLPTLNNDKIDFHFQAEANLGTIFTYPLVLTWIDSKN
jgi:hypothetical protein